MTASCKLPTSEPSMIPDVSDNGWKVDYAERVGNIISLPCRLRGVGNDAPSISRLRSLCVPSRAQFPLVAGRSNQDVIPQQGVRRHGAESARLPRLFPVAK